MVTVPADPETAPAPAQRRSQARTRIDYLDGLRALAALYVVFSHIRGETWTVHKPTGIFAIVNQWLGYGHFGVSVFIVISGFCLMLPVIRNGGMLSGGFAGFIKRRARRLLPPYYVALLVSLILALTLLSAKTGTEWDISIPVTAGGIFSHVFLLQDLTLPTLISFPLWSVSVEWRIYFLFPPLVIFWRRLGPLRTTLLVGLITSGVYLLFRRINLLLLDGFASVAPQYILLFALGMLGATIAFSPDSRWVRLRERVPWTFLAACAIVGFLLLVPNVVLPDYGVSDGLLGIGILSLMVAAAHEGRHVVRRALSWKPLVFVGTMSYSLYLLHAPLLQLIWQYGLRPLHLSDDVTFLCLVIVGAPLIVGATYVFHLVAERPFMAAARKPATTRQKLGLRLRWIAD